VLACILMYLINSERSPPLRRPPLPPLTHASALCRLTFLLKFVYPATRFFNALDPNAEPEVEPEWQHPGYVKGLLHLVLAFVVSIVPPPYAYADLN